jgi:cytochrome b
MTTDGVKLDHTTRVLHLGLLVFGVWAWRIGEDAGDYHKPLHPGFTLHMYVGLAFTAVLLLRLLYGLLGPREQRFSTWMPYTRVRWAKVQADLTALKGLKLPEPATHQGLNAAVQSLGLLLFTWQGLSGTLMSIAITPGERVTGWLHAVKEIHQWSQFWIPAYLALHVGAAVLHALTGRHIWKKMVFME